MKWLALHQELLGQVRAGNLAPLDVMADQCGKDLGLFSKLITPLLRILKDEQCPSLEDPALMIGSAPSLKSVALATKCFKIIDSGFANITQNIIDPNDTEDGMFKASCMTTSTILDYWQTTRRWITFFLSCLDFHRQADVIIPEYTGMYRTMLSASVGILSRMGLTISLNGTDQAEVEAFLGCAPGFIGLITQLIMLPSLIVTTKQSWADVTRPLNQFTAFAPRTVAGVDFLAGIGEVLSSRGAIVAFQDRLESEIDGQTDPSALEGYTCILFLLSIVQWPPSDTDFTIDPMMDDFDPAFFREGFFQKHTVTLVAKLMSKLTGNSGPPSMILLRCLRKCASYLLQSIRDEGRLAILDALEGPWGLLSCISASSPILSGDEPDMAELRTQISELYSNILHEITIHLIHPSVLRRCSRLLQKSGMALASDIDKSLSPLISAEQAFFKAVFDWQSRRSEYKAAVHSGLCANEQCPMISVSPTSIKRCVGCLTTTYCSLSCQRSDWKSHRSDCNERAIVVQDHREHRNDSICPFDPVFVYFQWISGVDAAVLIPPKRLLLPESVIEINYRRIPVEASVPSLAAFRKWTRRQTLKGPFTYAVIPNGKHTFAM
ncbi:hypothetical protein C8J56DRAFT_520064 [Mycena floridula]|nr:hypothetical protein C8J56DRAFT_520064 [Mycena floridula]